ncbi:MAG: cell division protein FtsZ [Ruminococcaceae bacterium]|nr:cell division protein FtsZ [Oscillospiraceae bacterium]
MAFEIDKLDDDFEVDEFEDATKIMVIGVGGGGGNAVDHMVEMGMTNIDYVVANTDVKALRSKDGSKMKRMQIGKKRTRGQGAGNNPAVGQESAEENHDELSAVMDKVSMVFVAAGMGGGTGTGAAPVVASIAKERNILTVGVVTKPFAWEGKEKMIQACKGIDEMQKYVDALIVIPNEKVKEISNSKLTMLDAFKAVDGVLYKAVRGISDLVTGVGFMNVDFADVTMALKDSGIAHMAMGKGKGDAKIQQALDEVLHSPLLETSISGARRVLLNVSIPTSCTLDDFDTISAEITKNAAPNARVKAGIMFDDTLEDDEMSIIAIATDFGDVAPSAVIPTSVTIDDRAITAATSSMSRNIGEEDTSDIDALLSILNSSK